jgi:hypothetical protein
MRNGNPNSRFYPLAVQAANTVFHDVTSGTNAVPCAGGSSGCSTKSGTNIGHMNGYSAGAGYDLATGLGSVDANNLATYWSNVTPPPTIVSLSPNPMTASSSNQTLTIAGSGFQSSPKVSLSCTGPLGPTSVDQHADSNHRQRRDHRPHLHRAGGQLQRPASNTVSLQVVVPAPPPPVIASVAPNPMTGSNSNQTLTINGSGFQSGSGLTVLVGYAGYTAMGAQVHWVSARRSRHRSTWAPPPVAGWWR